MGLAKDSVCNASMSKKRPKGKTIWLNVSLFLALITSLFWFHWSAEVGKVEGIKLIGLQPATAQSVRQEEVWQKVYERLPSLPRENQYINRETGEVDADSNLVSRLVEYHLKVKSRPPSYRFDWKLTLADYLGVNEKISELEYPGYNTLVENPMEGDRAAIAQLNRAQRGALVEVLVSVFSPNRTETPTPRPSASPSPTPTPNPRVIPALPQPGDARLLLP